MIMRVGDIGWRQTELLNQAARSSVGFVRPWNFLDRRSCHRLAARGLLEPAIGWPDTWRLVSERA
jgi:hypothetical protein